MTISIKKEKAFDKFQQIFMIKILKIQERRKRRAFPQPDKVIYEKPTVNIIINGE